MGLFDKMAGRPQAPRKSTGKRDERHNERASMRASRDSASWIATSPSNSTTGQGGYGHAPSYNHGYSQSNNNFQGGYPSSNYGGQQGGYSQGAPSRRVSAQGSRRASSPQQPSPVPSPRNQDGGSMFDKVKHFVGMTPMAATGSNMNHNHNQGPPPNTGSGHLNAGPQGQGRNPDSQHMHRPPIMEDQGRAASQSSQLQEQVRELTQKIHNMDAELHEVEGIKQKLIAEQRSAQDWRDKWNYQNFKLNLMVDMLVLQSLEAEAVGSLSKAGGQLPSQVPTSKSLVSSLNKPSITVPGAQQQPQQIPAVAGLAGVGRTASSRRVQDMVEEDYDG